MHRQSAQPGRDHRKDNFADDRRLVTASEPLYASRLAGLGLGILISNSCAVSSFELIATWSCLSFAKGRVLNKGAIQTNKKSIQMPRVGALASSRHATEESGPTIFDFFGGRFRDREWKRWLRLAKQWKNPVFTFFTFFGAENVAKGRRVGFFSSRNTHTCKHTHMQTHTHTHTRTCIYMHIHANTHTHTHAQIHIYTHIPHIHTGT